MSDLPSILEARGLRKSFRSGDRQLDVLLSIDFSLTTGETVSIRGESGSGKTTLLHLLAGLDQADAGDLYWNDQSVRTLSGDDRARRRTRFLGLVFQSFYLVPELDARANVLLPARLAGKVGQTERERASQLLAGVGLAERGRHLPSQLSGGERQRVAIARALMNRPEVLLADEPTGNLDERTGDAVMELLLALCAEQKTALVLVTHNPQHAARCGRRLALQGGALAEA